MNKNRNYTKRNPRASKRSKSRNREEDEKFTKSKSVGDKITEPVSLDKVGRDNDPNWYIKDPRLAEQVARISFHSYLGEGNVASTKYKMPSVAVFTMNPSPMNSYDFAFGSAQKLERSGLNLAITKLYTLLSTFSGRASTYAPQDLATLILSMAEVVSMSEDIRRAFGLCFTFSERNRSMPKTLINALGYDYDDLVRNRAIYIDRFNSIITRFNQLPILGNISYIIKARDMYQKVYTDSQSAEAQLIAMAPNTTWTIDETSYSGGTICKTTPWFTLATMKDKLDTLTNMVEALFGSSTLNIIYADLLNLSTKMSFEMFKLDYLTTDYIVVPEYNFNFLMQIHNLDIIGHPINTTLTSYGTYYTTPANDVYPDANDNSIIYNPGFPNTYMTGAGVLSAHRTSLLDLPDENPSVENVIECTRFKAMSNNWTEVVGSSTRTLCNVLPDHYCTAVRIHDNSGTTLADGYLQNNWYDTTALFSAVGSTHAHLINVFGAHTKFDWFPIMYGEDVSVDDSIRCLSSDFNFYTDVPITTLQAMNQIFAQFLFDFSV